MSGRATSRCQLALMLGLVIRSTLARAEPAKPHEPSCPVRLLPAETAGEWRKAELELRQKVRSWSAPDRDCRDLLIQVSGNTAWLTITTVDGRQARRQVSKPQELVAAASALAIGVASPRSELSFEETRAAQVTTVEPTRASDPPAMLLLGAGVHLGVPGGLWAPILRGAAMLEAGAWEMGAFVDWAPRHWLGAGDAPPRFSMWSLSSGAAVGRRQPLGAVDFLAGALFAASFTHQESTTEQVDDGELEIDVEEGDGVDLHLGGYVGVATSRANAVRVRGQLELLLPTSHPGIRRELDADLPPLPGCWFNAVVGVEWGVP